jgi:hypothetical protein
VKTILKAVNDFLYAFSHDYGMMRRKFNLKEIRTPFCLVFPTLVKIDATTAVLVLWSS